MPSEEPEDGARYMTVAAGGVMRIGIVVRNGAGGRAGGSFAA